MTSWDGTEPPQGYAKQIRGKRVSDREGMLRSLVTLAASDGRIVGAESRLLQALCSKWGISSDRLAQFVAEAKAGSRPVVIPKGAAERLELFEVLVEVAAADGSVVERERAILDAVAKRLRLEAHTIDELIAGALGERPASATVPIVLGSSVATGADAPPSRAPSYAEQQREAHEARDWVIIKVVAVGLVVLLISGMCLLVRSRATASKARQAALEEERAEVEDAERVRKAKEPTSRERREPGRSPSKRAGRLPGTQAVLIRSLEQLTQPNADRQWAIPMRLTRNSGLLANEGGVLRLAVGTEVRLETDDTLKLLQELRRQGKPDCVGVVLVTSGPLLGRVGGVLIEHLESTGVVEAELESLLGDH
jgi:tellurite resistance protein